MISKRVGISMRRLIAAGVVVVLIGGSATFALVGRQPSSPKAVAAKSDKDGPGVETARLFSAQPPAPPAPDLIATKLISQVAWPEVAKPIVKVKAVKTAAAPPTKSKPKPKKQTVRATGSL
jgi:hypothetical protein